MKRPRIEGIPGDYEPRYPRRLDRADYEALVAPDQQRRIAAAAAAASVAFGASLAAQDPAAAAAREQQVLQLLNRAVGGQSYWLEHATLLCGTDKHGVPQVLPQIPISFGNSHNGVFDAERARQLARELFSAYGLKPQVDFQLEHDGVVARLDLYDPAVQVGCKLRGKLAQPVGPFAGAEPEAPGRALDDDELGRLAASGHRIQALELDWFPLMDGDQVTPTLAYLAGIVAFLNSVTGGHDIDLQAILERHEVRVPLPVPTAGKAVVIEPAAGSPACSLQVDKESELTFQLRLGDDCERRQPPTERFGQPTWKPEALPRRWPSPVLLRLPSLPQVAVTLEQGGKPPLRLEARGPLLFLPRQFDPRAPFTLTLRLSPGGYTLEGYVVFGGLAP